jgi:protocatechuate 3,4-dioxygenase beta subunit
MTRVASRSTWSIALILLAFAGLALAQPTAQPILTGTVLGPEGRPLAGARVELVPVLPDFEQARRGLEGSGEPAPVKTSDTDAAGRFTLQAPETGIWTVTVRTTGLNPFASSPFPLVAPRELAPIAMAAMTTPTPPPPQSEAWQDVRLLDRSGAPVQGAVLRGDQKRPIGRTDAQGRLRLPVPASGSIRLQMLLADGRQIGAELTRSASERTFTLADPAMLAGQVVDEKGRKPIAGALVWTTLDPGAFVRTDAQGRFRLPAPWRRRFEVEVLAAGFLTKKMTIPVPHLASGRDATFALTRAAAVRGKVTDPSGRPLPGATVLAIPAAAVGERAFDPSAPVADRAVSDAQGGFALPNLRPDETYEVRASRAGAFPAFQRLTLGDSLAGPRTLTLILAPARAARGKVQDSAGKPIEGAEIVLRPALRPGSLRVPSPSGEPAGPDAVTVQSDGKGVFSIAACPAPEFEIQVRKKGYVPAILPALRLPAETKPPGPADLGIVILRPGAQLAGRVIDRRNRAISGAEVFALERLVGVNEVEGALKGRKPEATTGADGHFTIEDLAKGTPVHLIVRSPGFLTQGVRAARPPTEKALVIRMEAANVLRGRVVDENDAPIPGARLDLRWQDHLPEERERRIGEPVFRGARTDADGRFEIREIPTGSAYLGVTASGFVPIEGRELELPRSPEAGELRLVLDRGAILQGRVTAASGEPVPGTRVGAAGVSALTDDDGLYWLEGVATGPGDVLVIHPSHGRLVKPFDIQPGVNVLDASFDPGVEVTGRVIDDAGRPVTGARVDLGTDSRFVRKQYQDVTGEDGRFRLMPVADGRYLLSAEAEGFSETAAAAAVEVAGQPVANLEITLDRGAMLSGEILGLAAEDLAKVTIEARGERGATADAWTDGRGRYEVRSLRPGDWVVRARLWDGQRQAQVRVSIGRSDREVTRDLEFDKRLTLSAQVLYDEEPLPEAKVSLRGERRAIERIVTTDYEGRFRLDDLEADTYRLGLNHPGKMLVHNDRIELQADREVTIRLQAATIGGLVVSQADGEPVDGALILLKPVEGPEFMVSGGTKEDGRFALYRVPPGSYRMEIRAQGFGPAERQVQVAGGEVRDDLEIRLSPTQGTKLQVRLASGQVPEFVHVLVRDPAGSTVLAESRRPDQDGVLELSTLSPGSWTLLAAADGGAMVSINLLVPSEPMAVTLPPAGRLLVRVPALGASEMIGTLQLIGADQQPLRTLGLGGQIQQHWSLIGGKGIVDGVPAGAWILLVETADGQRWQGAAVTSGVGEAAVGIE